MTVREKKKQAAFVGNHPGLQRRLAAIATHLTFLTMRNVSLPEAG